MQIVYVVVTVFLAAALLISAVGKLTRMEQVVEGLSKAGVTDWMYRPLAALEVTAAAGLLIGIWVPWLAVATAIGVVLYFVGAVVFHLRAHDMAIGPPAFLGALGVVALILRVVTA